jgi:HEAT repeat protein/beta-lactamase regulating signal transducer with metallopeptidase domain
MIDTLSSAVLAWLLTYVIHSTALLLLALAITRARRWSPWATDVFWKAALVGGFVSATVQLGLEHRPAGSVSLATAAPVVSTTTATHASSVEHALPANVESAETVDAPAPAEPSVTSPVDSRPASSVPVRGIAVTVWAIVALGLALVYAARRFILVGRIGDRRAVLDGRLLAELERLTREAGLRRRPRLTSTTRISSPIALGVGEICLPESALTELDLEQQRSMLAHELGHLARRDPIWLGFVSVVERVFWIQPLNRLARRGIATSAEYLCDEWAVRRTGSGVALARCLAQVAEWIQTSPLGVPVAGMAEERSLLVSRVERLLAGRGFDAPPKRLLAFASIAVVAATIAIVPGVTGRAVQASAVIGLPDDATASQPMRLPPDAPSAAPNAGAASAPHRTLADSTVVVALIGRLRDEDAEVRAAAAQSLGKLEDSRAVPSLIAVIGDRDAKVRAAVAEALGKFTDPRAVSALSSLLRDSQVDVRKQALEALSEYESGVPVAGIVPLLSDSDADLRHDAAHALGKFGDQSAGAALAPLVRDPSPDVRQAAIESIADLHDAAHASAILPALSDTNPDVRQQAIEALDNLRVSIPEAAMLALLRDGNADVRSKAANVAGERSVIAAIPSLRRLMDDPDHDVRENAISALANIADDAATAALRAGLGSKDAKVRRAAAEALGDRRE